MAHMRERRTGDREEKQISRVNLSGIAGAKE